MHGNKSQNGYGNAIIGRYGGYGNAIIGRYCGCFEKCIRRVLCAGGSCAALEWLARWKGESAYNPWTHISHKELVYLLQKLINPRRKILLRMLLGGEVGRS